MKKPSDFSLKTVVCDKWWPWRTGHVFAQMKSTLRVMWSDGEVWKYDRPHLQFLESVK